MARAATKVNSPTPYNVIGAAHEIGCTPGTLYEYIRAERIKPQYTPAGHAILYDERIEQAREIFQRRRTRRG